MSEFERLNSKSRQLFSVKDFESFENQATPKTTLNEAIIDSTKTVIPSLAFAAILLITASVFYLIIYMFTAAFPIVGLKLGIDLIKMSNIITVVIHNATLLAGWVLYLNDKFRKASD